MSLVVPYKKTCHERGLLRVSVSSLASLYFILEAECFVYVYEAGRFAWRTCGAKAGVLKLYRGRSARTGEPYKI